MGIADGNLRPVEANRICEVYERLTDQVIDHDHIGDLVEAHAADKTPTHDLLSDVREELDRTTKENILKASYLTLIADGEISAEEHKRLRDFARALRIEEVHFNAIMEDLADLA